MKKGILFVLTAAFLASCQQEENEGVASVDRVTITPIITRATEVNFEDQDQIGLSVTKEDGTVYATNELIREYFFKCVMDLATAPALHNLPAS